MICVKGEGAEEIRLGEPLGFRSRARDIYFNVDRLMSRFANITREGAMICSTSSMTAIRR